MFLFIDGMIAYIKFSLDSTKQPSELIGEFSRFEVNIQQLIVLLYTKSKQLGSEIKTQGCCHFPPN